MIVKKKTLGWNVKKLALNVLISQDPTSAAVSEDIKKATNTVKVTNISVSKPLFIPAEWEGQDSLFASRKLTVKNFKVRLASNILICWNELLHFEIKHPFHSGCDRERNGSVLR